MGDKSVGSNPYGVIYDDLNQRCEPADATSVYRPPFLFPQSVTSAADPKLEAPNTSGHIVVQETPKDKVKTKSAKTATFSPAVNELNSRFDKGAVNSGGSVQGKSHFLKGDDETNFVKAFGKQGGTVKEMQGGAGLVAGQVDGRIGGRTTEAVAKQVLKAPAFAFGTVSTAADAEACARSAEFMLETIATSPNFSDADRAAIKGKIEGALAKIPAELQSAVAERAGAMKGNATGVADAKSMLQTAAKPIPVDVAKLPVDKLVALAGKTDALDATTGAALKARLVEPAVLTAVLGDAKAMANSTVVAAVKEQIAKTKTEDLPALATAAAKAPADVKKAVGDLIDAAACKVDGPPTSDKMATLSKLAHAAKTLDPQAAIPAHVKEAVVGLIGNASTDQLEGRDRTGGAANGFADDLKTFFGGTLPDDVTKAVGDRKLANADTARIAADAERVQLAKGGPVNDAYQKIMGKMETDGLSENEQTQVVALFKDLGGVDKAGAMSERGAHEVGALVGRLISDGKWDTFISKMDGSDGTQLLHQLAKLPASAVSSDSAAKIAKATAANGSDSKADAQIARKLFNDKFQAKVAPTAERKAMLDTIKSEPDLTRAVLLDKQNISHLRETCPQGDVATTFASAFPERDEKVAFMTMLVDTVANVELPPADRAWARKALDQAQTTWHKPLSNSDLAKVKEHIDTIEIDRDSIAADAQAQGNAPRVQQIRGDQETNWLFSFKNLLKK